MSLMMRHYDPQQGQILLDGKDLRSYDPRAVRSCISIVAQENEAFTYSCPLERNPKTS